MNNRMFYLSFILVFTISCSSNKTCKDYKTGKFELVDEESGRKYEIERNDSIQIETNLSTGEESKYNVVWNSACEYTLTVFEGREEVMAYYKDKKLTVEILKVYDNSYKFSAVLDGETGAFEQTLTKID